ncbi:hypothetical protein CAUPRSCDRAFT_11889 [Caulochytrium protostelioides]|uniref:Uncharacterized protein n=1 Tax=Caulochytrium protostelioides TaxID=1555241 RepID=A0A4P9WT54_9FUNG|nr:hypothetical protein CAUPRSCDRAFT_11889 [Caulochytrium protostelioides]
MISLPLPLPALLRAPALPVTAPACQRHNRTPAIRARLSHVPPSHAHYPARHQLRARGLVQSFQPALYLAAGDRRGGVGGRSRDPDGCAAARGPPPEPTALSCLLMRLLRPAAAPLAHAAAAATPAAGVRRGRSRRRAVSLCDSLGCPGGLANAAGWAGGGLVGPGGGAHASLAAVARPPPSLPYDCCR